MKTARLRKSRKTFPNQRVPGEILKKLIAARDTAKMETASFGFPKDRVSATHHMDAPIVDMHPTDYIREKTATWRHSWIINPLDEIIAWAEGKDA